jgi:AraC-like DNA-binding protein
VGDALDLIGTGIRLAGVIHLAVLAGYVTFGRDLGRLAIVPALYTVTLGAALLRPLVLAPGVTFAEQAVWTVSLGLSAATYLLVLQLVDRRLPVARHAYVLLIPLLALPGVHLAAYFGRESACLAGGLCMPVSEAVMLYEVLTGAPLLLLIWLLRGPALAAMRRSGQRMRLALVLTILALQALILGIGLLKLFAAFPAVRLDLSAAVLKVTMIYLVGSALFRVDAALVPATVPTRAETAEAAPPPAPDRAPTAAAASPSPPDARSDERGGKNDADTEPLSESEQELLEKIEALMQLDKLYQQQGFSRRQLADELGVAEHHISRAVNVGRNQSFTEMINGYRVAEAADLLTKTDESITEIAFAVGFNSLATFNRVFRQRMDTSPSQYRKRQAETPAETAAQT